MLICTTKDGSVAEGWKNLMREAKKTGRPINEETILYDAFRRLVEICLWIWVLLCAFFSTDDDGQQMVLLGSFRWR